MDGFGLSVQARAPGGVLSLGEAQRVATARAHPRFTGRQPHAPNGSYAGRRTGRPTHSHDGLPVSFHRIESLRASACRCCAISPKWVVCAGLGGGDASVAPPEFGALADTLGRTECSCQAPAMNPRESHAIRSAGLNQDDGPPHSVRMREGTPFAGCEDGLRPTSDGDRDRSATLANPAGDDELHPRRNGTDRAGDPFAYEMIEPKAGRECPCCEA